MAQDSQLAVAGAEQVAALEVRQQVNQLQYLMSNVLKQGEHYGVIPGTKGKPSLLQPGAEKICLMFKLVPRYRVEKTQLPGGHREVEVTCTLYQRGSDVIEGEGMGSCSTMESKYRYRNKWVNNQKVREENADIADTWNTVLKMAKKRAFVDAVKSTTAASDIFTQDVEDLPQYMLRPQEVQPTVETPQQPAKPTPTSKEKKRMAEVAELAAESGINLDEARKYIWSLYQANGMPSVETWAAQIAPQQAPEPEQAEVAYEEAVEPDLYDEDASF